MNKNIELKTCPCGTNVDYTDCCGKYISGESLPATPELLMRSRYTAYTLAEIDYVFDTMRDEALKDADRVESLKWAKNSTWLGLKILNAPDVESDSTDGEVEFIASYESNNKKHELQEHSKFKKINNRWYYVGSVYEKDNLAETFEPITTVRVNKVGRNDPCSCGSGKKHKKCCLA
jgi:SEC-C motif-containing protein